MAYSSSSPPAGRSKLPKEVPSSNSKLVDGNITGVAANHSSEVASIGHSEMESHFQYDDDIQGISPPIDPNISGDTATEDTYTWLAGPISSWKENDDYRTYFENSEGYPGLFNPDAECDGDYDDNGQIPTAIGHGWGSHGRMAGTAEDKHTAAPGFDVRYSQARLGFRNSRK